MGNQRGIYGRTDLLPDCPNDTDREILKCRALTKSLGHGDAPCLLNAVTRDVKFQQSRVHFEGGCQELGAVPRKAVHAQVELFQVVVLLEMNTRIIYSRNSLRETW